MHRAAERSGMQVAVRTDDFHLRITKSAKAVGDGRNAFLEYVGIRNDDQIAFEQIFMSFDQSRKIFTADFFFSLEDDFDVRRKRSAVFQECFNRFDVNKNLTLIVRCAPCIKIAIAYGRLEWRCFPFIERIFRLDIVMTVNKERRRAGSIQPIRIHGRMTGCFQNLDVLQSDHLQMILQPFRRTPHFRFAFCLRAYAGNR